MKNEIFNLIKFSKFNYAISLILLVWFGFVLLFSHLMLGQYSSYGDHGFYLSELLLDIVIMVFSWRVYCRAEVAAKLYFFFLFLSYVSCFLTDINFYTIFILLKVKKPSNLYDSFYLLPFLGYVLFQLCFWYGVTSKFLLGNANKVRTFLLFFLVNLIAIIVFIITSEWKVDFFSYLGLYQVISGAFELIIFDLAALSLICSRNRGVYFISSASIILLASNFWEKYLFLNQKMNVFDYSEFFWFLSLILSIIGLFLLSQKTEMKSWFRSLKGIKSQVTLWIFGLCVLSFLLLFLVAYHFSIINQESFVSLPFLIMIYSVIVVLLSNFIGNKFEEPFRKLSNNIEILMSSSGKKEDVNADFFTEEFIFLQKFLLNMLEINREKDKVKKELGSITAQVAHDIRSPIAALNAVVKEATQIPEQQRIIMRNATQQINDIANNLLAKYRTRSDASLHEENNGSLDTPEVIAVLLDSIISEKRVQYKHLPININLDIETDAHGAFAKIIASDFKRVVSNIINNAVEAISGRGEVTVKLSKSSNFVKLDIKDTGTGMPLELINKVFDGSLISSKKEGSGIGLLSARTLVESWGGALKITSEPGIGTIVHLTFVLLKHASWFASELTFIENSKVVILDDDQSIHDVWESRFSHEIPSAHLQLLHFYQAKELLNYDMSELKSARFLCDYELIGQDESGLDVIEQLNLGTAATLVTSRYDDREIRQRSKKLGIKILPKNYAAYVPLNIVIDKKEQRKDTTGVIETPDLVLIDDNSIVTDSWVFAATLKKKKILTFNSFDEAIKNIQALDRSTPIYIDSDLGAIRSGEEYAKELYGLGFKTIYLATGYDASRFETMYWIKGIVGKDPVL